MRSWVLPAGLAVASILVASAAPGAERTHVLYEPGFEDVGMWDAVVTVRLRDGSFRTLRGIEVNTIGCGGTCVESERTPALETQLPDVRAGGTAVVGGAAKNADPGLPMNRRERLDSRVSSDGLAFTPGWGGDGAGASTPTRTAMTYVSPNRRILAIFARVRGSERLQMRVEYTRR
jgi:hypothetical protein